MKGTVESGSNFSFQRYKFRSLIFYSFESVCEKPFRSCNKRRRFQMPTVRQTNLNEFFLWITELNERYRERGSNFPFQRYKFRSHIFYSFENVYEKPFRSCKQRTRFQMPTVCNPNFNEFFVGITELNERYR